MAPTPLKFPIFTKTREGTEVTLLAHNASSDRPWVGVLTAHTDDGVYKRIPYSWLPTGAYVSTQTPRALDIAVPI